VMAGVSAGPRQPEIARASGKTSASRRPALDRFLMDRGTERRRYFPCLTTVPLMVMVLGE
jgi:hypothetical protein